MSPLNLKTGGQNPMNLSVVIVIHFVLFAQIILSSVVLHALMGIIWMVGHVKSATLLVLPVMGLEQCQGLI